MSVFELTVSVSFSGAHFLRGYEGSCSQLHGHNFRVEVRVGGDQLNGLGMLVDFKVIKQKVRSVIQKLDHQTLNEMQAFRDTNPTAENIARYIFGELAPAINDAGARLVSIGVWETEGYGAVYTP